MFRIFYLVVLFLIVVIFAPYFIGKQGFVLIDFSNYEIRTSVVVLLIATIVLVAIIYFVEFFIRKIFQITYAPYTWIDNKRIKNSEKSTNEGLIKLIEGDYKKAEKLILKGLKYSKNPEVCLLNAFEISLKLNNIDEAEKYLNEAKKYTKNKTVIIKSTVDLYIKTEQWQKASELLSDLLLTANTNNDVILQSLLVYEKTNNYTELEHVIKIANKNKQITHNKLTYYIDVLEKGLINKYYNDNVSILTEWWNKKAKFRKTSIKANAYLIELLINNNHLLEAEDVVIKSLKNFNKADLVDNILLSSIKRLTTSNKEIYKILIDISNKNINNIDINRLLTNLYFNIKDYKEASIYLDKYIHKTEHVNHEDYSLATIIYVYLDKGYLIVDLVSDINDKIHPQFDIEFNDIDKSNNSIKKYKE